jgi:hypothetical protein
MYIAYYVVIIIILICLLTSCYADISSIPLCVYFVVFGISLLCCIDDNSAKLVNGGNCFTYADGKCNELDEKECSGPGMKYDTLSMCNIAHRLVKVDAIFPASWTSSLTVFIGLSDSKTEMVLPIESAWLIEYKKTDEYKKSFTEKITSVNLQRIIGDDVISSKVTTYLKTASRVHRIRVTPVIQKLLPDSIVLDGTKFAITYKYNRKKARSNVNLQMLIKHICRHKLIKLIYEYEEFFGWYDLLIDIITQDTYLCEWAILQFMYVLHKVETREPKPKIYEYFSSRLTQLFIGHFKNIDVGLVMGHLYSLFPSHHKFDNKVFNDTIILLSEYADNLFENKIEKQHPLWNDPSYNNALLFDSSKIANIVIDDEKYKYHIEPSVFHKSYRYIIIPVAYTFTLIGGGGGHYNILIIDKIEKSVYLFEPHLDNEWHNDLLYILKDQILNDYLPESDLFSSGYKWDSSQSYINECPSGSIQDQDSFCQTWIILVTMMHILNPMLDKLAVYEYLRNNDNIDLKYKIIMLFQHYLYHVFEADVEFKKIA